MTANVVASPIFRGIEHPISEHVQSSNKIFGGEVRIFDYSFAFNIKIHDRIFFMTF